MDIDEKLYRAAVRMMNDHRVPKRVRVRFFKDMVYERFDKAWCESSAARAKADPDVPDEDWVNEGPASNGRRSDVLTFIARKLMRIELGPLGNDPIEFLRRCYDDLSEETLADIRRQMERTGNLPPRDDDEART